MGGPDGVLKQHKRSQGDRGVYPVPCQVRISDMFAWGSSELTVSLLLEWPVLRDQVQILRPLSKRPTDKGRIQRGGAPGRIRRLWEGECVYEWVCLECNSLKVCMLACKGTAHFLPPISHGASVFPFHVVVALLGAPTTLTSLPSPAWPALPLPSVLPFNAPCHKVPWRKTASIWSDWSLRQQ